MRSLVLQSIRSLTIVSRWLTYAATFCLALLMAINVIDIIGTKWFYWTFPGAIDYSEELMVLLTLLPIAFVQLERGHINITFLQDRMSVKGQFIIRTFQYVVSILVMGFWSWRSFAQFQLALVNRQMKYGIDFPTWPANLGVVVSFIMLTAVLVLLFVKSLLSELEEHLH